MRQLPTGHTTWYRWIFHSVNRDAQCVNHQTSALCEKMTHFRDMNNPLDTNFHFSQRDLEVWNVCFYRWRTMVNYVCHSENSNCSRARAGAGCGEAGGGSNDLWLGSHACSADRGFHPPRLCEQSEQASWHTTKSEHRGEKQECNSAEGNACFRAALTTHTFYC